MIKIESLKDYLEITSNEEFINLATKIYMITASACKDYPNHKEWYFNKQLPALVEDERNILFVRNPDDQSEIIAMACLKKNDDEQKVCTLFVSDKYRGLGIGTSILEESMKWLGTTKPLITITEHKLEMFKPIINRYNWKLIKIISGLYNDGQQELCFNGTLTKNNENTLEQQLHERLIKILKYRKKHFK